MKIDENNINQVISTNLKIARQIRGLRLADVGKILSITYQQSQKYESGKNPISINKLVLLAQHLNLPITFFFEEFKLTEKAS